MVDREADNVTEINLGVHFNHSAAGSRVGEADPCLRTRRHAGGSAQLLGRVEEGEVAASSGASIGRGAVAELL